MHEYEGHRLCRTPTCRGTIFLELHHRSQSSSLISSDDVRTRATIASPESWSSQALEYCRSCRPWTPCNLGPEGPSDPKSGEPKAEIQVGTSPKRASLNSSSKTLLPSCPNSNNERRLGQSERRRRDNPYFNPLPPSRHKQPNAWWCNPMNRKTSKSTTPTLSSGSRLLSYFGPRKRDSASN